MKRVGSLIVFLVVGLCVAWFTRTSLTGATHFIVAFLAAAGAAWVFERFTGQAPKPGP